MCVLCDVFGGIGIYFIIFNWESSSFLGVSSEDITASHYQEPVYELLMSLYFSHPPHFVYIT